MIVDGGTVRRCVWVLIVSDQIVRAVIVAPDESGETRCLSRLREIVTGHESLATILPADGCESSLNLAIQRLAGTQRVGQQRNFRLKDSTPTLSCSALDRRCQASITAASSPKSITSGS